MVTVHVLTGSGRLEGHAGEIERVASQALARLALSVPLEGVDVVVQDLPAAAIPGLGVGGYAPSGHLVQVSLDPLADGFADKLVRHLPRTLAHEWHHVARWRGPGYGATLGGALVSEGLADHFDLEVNGGEPYAWARALDDEQVVRWLGRARELLWRPGCDHARWFFNRGGNGPPYHAGYALGFALVRGFLERNLGAKPSELWGVSAEVVVEGSGLMG